MPKFCRDKTYFKAYRAVRSSVNQHLNAVYGEEESISGADVDTDISSFHVRSQCNVNRNLQDNSFEGNVCYPTHNALNAEAEIDVIDNCQSNEFTSNVCSDQSDVESDSEILSDCNNSFEESLHDNLTAWATKFHISQTALRELLQILTPLHDSLPKDPRTLLQTQKFYDISEICGGHYHHFGVEEGIRKQLSSFSSQQFPNQQETLELQINIDGLPLFKSSNTQFWPILGRLVSPIVLKPFVIGIFVGNSKPSDISVYLKDFVDEMNGMEDSTVVVSGVDCQFTVRISCVICDAPARAYVKQIKGHSGYFGCDKCVQKGVWEGKMTFPEIGAENRTDAMFDEMADAGHHIGTSPFADLNIGMVSQFPLDYMHLVCLGVVKRLLAIWMKGPLTCGRQAASSLSRVSDSLLYYRKYLPREFLRKGRPLREVDRWKAAEFRQFLLYTGPVSLHDILPPVIYRHFLLLSVSIYCLSSDFFCIEYASYCHQILQLFVEEFAKLYGRDMVVYNVHGLTHLADDVRRFGPLDHFSSFVFESFLGQLKRLVRKPNSPLQQVIRRMSENVTYGKDMDISPIGKVMFQHQNGPLPCHYRGFQQFKQIQLPDVFLSVEEGEQLYFS